MVIRVDSLYGVVVILMILDWFFFAAIFFFHRKTPQTAPIKTENRSRLGIAIQGCGFALVWAAHRSVSGPPFPVGHPYDVILAVVIIALGPLSCIFALSAVRTLGKQWTYVARVIEGHELVTTGPYSLVRNPIYLGMFGMLLMTALAWTRWWATLIAIIIFLVGTAVRIRSEEKLLRATFGSKFDDYARRVPALIPWLI
jgi:protein-S-isoprenylcysteine O-methyltransferase Ste14